MVMGPRTVYIRHLAETISVPAATTQAAPVSLSVNLGETFLERASILVPPGHAALTGIALEYDGLRIVPWGGSSAWLRGDGEVLELPIEFVVSHPIIVKGFNSDVYDHDFHLRFVVDDSRLFTQGPQQASVVPIAQ